MHSPQTSYRDDESFNVDFKERINNLNTSLTNQLASVPNTNSSLDKIVHLFSVVFRSLRKNLQSKEKLFTEYNSLSDTIQKLISIFAQYTHDRHEHENDVFSFKNKISQIIGETGYRQNCLEQYWTIIHSLEHETERLEILLRKPEFLQINQQKFQTFEETQRVQLDRFIKDNEKLKILINKQKDSISTMQTQIEIDIKELQTLKPILHKIKFEQNDIQYNWSQIGFYLLSIVNY